MCIPRTLVGVVVLFRMAVAFVPFAPPGGLLQAPTNSREVVRAALFATQRYNFYYSREPAAFKTVRVVSAATQVVAGTKYFLEVLLGLTQCRKDAPYWVLHSCPLQAPDKPLLCKFVVTDVPWERGMDLTEVNCRPFRRWWW